MNKQEIRQHINALRRPNLQIRHHNLALERESLTDEETKKNIHLVKGDLWSQIAREGSDARIESGPCYGFPAHFRNAAEEYRLGGREDLAQDALNLYEQDKEMGRTIEVTIDGLPWFVSPRAYNREFREGRKTINVNI